MAFPVIMAAMLGAQLLQQQQQAKEKRKVDAANARYGMWTGMRGDYTPGPNLGGEAMKFYGMHQAQEQADTRSGLENEELKARTSMWNHYRQQGPAKAQGAPAQDPYLSGYNADAVVPVVTEQTTPVPPGGLSGYYAFPNSSGNMERGGGPWRDMRGWRRS